MTHNEALDKCAKLLRLAQSNNPHEAAAAAACAQEIMDRFKLTGADIIAGEAPKSEEPVRHFAEEPLDNDGRDRWKGQLGVVIAKQNQCKLYADNGSFILIGRASDVMTVRYLYGWLVREIERLAAQNCKGTSRTYWNNFRLGAVEIICQRLRAAATQTVASVQAEASVTPDGGLALMVLEKSLARIEKQTREVEDYGKRVLHLRARSGSRTRYDGSAREAGRKAGASINLGGARGSLGNGQVRIGQ